MRSSLQQDLYDAKIDKMREDYRLFFGGSQSNVGWVSGSGLQSWPFHGVYNKIKRDILTIL